MSPSHGDSTPDVPPSRPAVEENPASGRSAIEVPVEGIGDLEVVIHESGRPELPDPLRLVSETAHPIGAEMDRHILQDSRAEHSADQAVLAVGPGCHDLDPKRPPEITDQVDHFGTRVTERRPPQQGRKDRSLPVAPVGHVLEETTPPRSFPVRTAGQPGDASQETQDPSQNSERPAAGQQDPVQVEEHDRSTQLTTPSPFFNSSEASLAQT